MTSFSTPTFFAQRHRFDQNQMTFPTCQPRRRMIIDETRIVCRETPTAVRIAAISSALHLGGIEYVEINAARNGRRRAQASTS
jgi:hypothetical protein